MFAYCGNNPVNRSDSSGHFFDEIWEFAKSAGESIKNVMNSWSQAYSYCRQISDLDGPSPYFDVFAAIGMISVTAGAVVYGACQAFASSLPSFSIPNVETKEKEVMWPAPLSKNQAYFPKNPYDFNPNGLIRTEYPGTKNGRIIEWKTPLDGYRIFEWDEDFMHGAHYHTFLIEWDGNHNCMHYYPGMAVPEPWNMFYFGGQ